MPTTKPKADVTFSNTPTPPVSPRPKKTAAKKASPAPTPAPVAEKKYTARTKSLGGRAEYVLVELGDIHRDPEQPRKTFRNVAELATSLQDEGMLQPIVCRVDLAGKLVIMYGERRYRAAQIAGWTHAPVIIRHHVKDDIVLENQLTENSHREDVDPIEEAHAIRTYMRTRKIATYAECADRLKHSLSWVANRMALLKLDPDDQEKVSSGELGVVKAAAIARQQTGITRARKVEKMAAARQNPPSTERGGFYFGASHPLAAVARARCRLGDRSEHDTLVGGVACGSCWEDVIRNDATRKHEATKGKSNGASVIRG